VKLQADDLFRTPLDQAQIDFENEGGETYICGNPPYQGSVNQKSEQKNDLKSIFGGIVGSYKDLDYVSAWFVKAAQYVSHVRGRAGLVATNSICQGEQVAMLWPYVFDQGLEIVFAYTSFPWSNNASNNAGVTCVIIGIGKGGEKTIYTGDLKRKVSSISPYLVEASSVVVSKRSEPLSGLSRMVTGNLPSDGGNLIMSFAEKTKLVAECPGVKRFLKKFVGSRELINGGDRWCLWIEDDEIDEAQESKEISQRLKEVKSAREASRGDQGRGGILTPHRFVFAPHRPGIAIAVPKVSSARRHYIPCSLSHWNSAMMRARRATSAGKSRSSIPRKLVSGISLRRSGSPRRRLISASIARISL
jgi:hypothetical protein